MQTRKSKVISGPVGCALHARPTGNDRFVHALSCKHKIYSQIFIQYIALIRFTVWSHWPTPLNHQQCGTHTWAWL